MQGLINTRLLKTLLIGSALALLTVENAVSAWSCCSLDLAKFFNTIGFVSELERQGKRIHLLAYENIVQNEASGGNALFLPIPAVPGSMSEKNVVDTSNVPDFMEKMQAAVMVEPSNLILVEFAAIALIGIFLTVRFKVVKQVSTVLGCLALMAACGRLFSSCSLSGSLDAGPMVFNNGIYTIVLAGDAKQIPGALDKVPESKRPHLNPAIFDSYAKWYKGWTFALCCFNNRDAARATPMLWWYEPQNPDLMFFPALDAHDGKPPVLDTSVEVDHVLMVASDKAEGFQDPKNWLLNPWRNFSYEKNNPEANEFVPRQVMGSSFRGKMQQGDFVFRTSDVRRGVFEPQRVLPPGVAGPDSIWNQGPKISARP